MADDDLDSLDGLDDFGSDDFGDQLDDFMDGDSSEGEDVDGDSELDSFFEDLSTIDDLEVKEEEPEDEPAEEIEESIEEHEPEVEPEEEKKDKKPILIPAIIVAVIGMILGGVALFGYWFFTQPEPEPEPIPQPVIVRPVAPVVAPPSVVFVTTVPTTTLPPLPPPPPEKENRYYVQVANCIYKECVEDSRLLLKRFGYKAKITEQDEIIPMTEVISRQVLGEEEASRWVKRINQENQLPGFAFRKEAGNQYKVTLGLFPDLDTATRVKTSLNQVYAKQLIFDAKRVDQTIQYSKIQTGRFSDREEAVQFQKMLMKKDKRFQGAFVITILE